MGKNLLRTECMGANDISKMMSKKSAKISDPAMKQKFIDTCNKMCEVTTLSKYNILKSMLDEMAKLYPDLKPWIAWWHSRHTHIFAPCRIEGLPEVNSEIGNAGWKP